MATNEIFKHSDWIPLPIPEAAENSVNGDPILVGGLVGVIQVVGGQTLTYEVGTTTVTTVESSTSLEPGWASVALTGAWAFEIDGAADADEGDTVWISQGTGGAAATLDLTAGDRVFGYLINMTTDGRAIVRIEGGEGSGS